MHIHTNWVPKIFFSLFFFFFFCLGDLNKSHCFIKMQMSSLRLLRFNKNYPLLEKDGLTERCFCFNGCFVTERDSQKKEDQYTMYCHLSFFLRKISRGGKKKESVG